MVATNASRRASWQSRFSRAALAACLIGLLGACDPDPRNTSPDGAVREFIEIMRQFDGNEQDAKAAFELLSDRAKKNLRARAERYGAASGKKIAPWAMLVPSRVAQRFAPQAYAAQVVGKYALVDVVGVSSDQKAQVPCVLENGLWRVDLVFPELAPVQRRPGNE